MVSDEEWPTQKSKSLLKILLNERGHLVPTDRLIEWLWPELPLVKARNNLWVTVSQVRRVLQPDLPKRGESDFIHRSNEGYSFNPSSIFQIDTDEFLSKLRNARDTIGWPERLQALESARTVYTGEYLEDDPYEDWAIPRRDELREQYLGLLMDLAEAAARLGRYRRAIAVCREALVIDPTRETIYQKLMIIHHGAGEQPQALKVYRECRKVLMEELGLEPSSVTEEIYHQISRNNQPVGDGDPYPPADYSSTENQPLSAIEFVGRGIEYHSILDLFNGVRLRRGHVVLIEGEPGIGKSRLLQEVITEARARGMDSLNLGCYRIEQSTPFQPLVELIGQAHQLVGDHLPELLSEATRAEIRILYPEFSPQPDRSAQPTSGVDEARQTLLFKALVDLLEKTSLRNGLLLAIDDIHSADPATLRFIHHLTRQIPHLPILFVLTYRGEETIADENLDNLIQSLSRASRVLVLHLTRLALEDITQIISSIAGSETSPQLTEWFFKETDGNPFFLMTILQSLLEQGLLIPGQANTWNEQQLELLKAGGRITLPDALRNSVRSRLQRLPRPSRDILEAAAVIGRRFEFGTLAKLVQLPDFDLLEVIEDLLERCLLAENEDGRHFDFSHDKIREVVYQELSHARRSYLHHKAAEAISSRETEEDEYAGTLAEHYVQAGDWTLAVHYLGKAADRSLQIFAIREALALYHRALDLVAEHPDEISIEEKIRLHSGRGTANLHAGEFDLASKDLNLVLNNARQSGDLQRQSDLLVSLGILHRREDFLDRASEYLNLALDVSRRLGDEQRVADTLYHLGTVVWSQGENIKAELFHSEAVDICKKHGFSNLTAAQAFHGLGEARWISGDFIEAFQLFHESLILSRDLGDRGLEIENLHNLGALHSDELVANYREARSYLQQSLSLTSDSALTWHHIPSLFILGLVIGSMGDYDRGIRTIKLALKDAERLKSPRYHSTALNFLGCLYRDLNLFDQAEAAFLEGLDISKKARLGFWLPRLQADLAIVRIRRGDFSVEKTLKDSLEISKSRGQGIHQAVCLLGLIELEVKRENFETALSMQEEMVELALLGMQEIMVQAYRWRGVALDGLGLRGESEAALLNAVELASKIDKPRLAYDVHVSLAKAYYRWGDMINADIYQRKADSAMKSITYRLRNSDLLAGLQML